MLQAITESGYSQREFARKFGIAENLISDWKRGVGKPSMASIRKVAEGSKKNLNWILVGDNITNSGNNSIVGKNQKVINYDKEVEYLKKELTLIKRENVFLREQLAAYKTTPKRKK
jgi:transcriptional regulator with XRE-family HTH domain